MIVNDEYYGISREKRLIQTYLYFCKKIIRQKFANLSEASMYVSESAPMGVRDIAQKGLDRLASEEDVLTVMMGKDLANKLVRGDGFLEEELKTLKSLQNKYIYSWKKEGEPKGDSTLYTDVLLLGGIKGQEWVKEELSKLKKA